MAVEPPLIKGHIHEGRNGTIVIGKSMGSDIETEHAGVPDGNMRVDAGDEE